MTIVNRFGIFWATRRLFWVAVVVVIVLVGAWPGGVAQSAESTQSARGGDTEVLLLYPPPGWHLAFATDIGGMAYREFVPAGDTPTQWAEKITVQALGANNLSPTDIANTIRNRFTTHCGRLSFRGPERFNLDGYLAARFYVECLDPSFDDWPSGITYRKHLVAAFQIIQGQQKTHVIERAWQGSEKSAKGAPYGRDDLWGWDGFWHHLEVCDFTETSRACFGLGLLSADKADVFAAQVNPALPYECRYFRVLSVLPDAAQPIKPTMVIPLKLGLRPFGSRPADLTLQADIDAAYRENRPVAVIITTAGSALSGILRTDTAKAARAAAALASWLRAGGVDGARLHQRSNKDCPGG